MIAAMSGGRACIDVPRLLTRLGSVAALAAGLVALAHSLVWPGAAFPGFFVMPNRVVPSAGLPAWSGVAEGSPPYQHVVLAVDDVPVASGEDVYRYARTHRVGDAVRYRLARNGVVDTRAFPLRRFSAGEHLVIFGMYLLTGAVYLALAVRAAARWHAAGPFRALAAFGWAGAVFAFTAVDLYAPGAMFRLHVAAEAALPAVGLHLALVCPEDRVRDRRALVPLLYACAAVVAIVYELFVDDPGAYSTIHNAVQALAAVPMLGLVVRLGLAAGTPPAALGEQGVAVLLGSALGGLVLPAVVFGLSGMTGGSLPVNVAGWTGFLFPLGCIVAFGLVPGVRRATALPAAA